MNKFVLAILMMVGISTSAEPVGSQYTGNSILQYINAKGMTYMAKNPHVGLDIGTSFKRRVK